MNAVKDLRDYRLRGRETQTAIDTGLAEATWYASPIPRDKMRQLLVRKDGPAIFDTLLWFALLFGAGAMIYQLWGSWWVIVPFLIYSILYGTVSDSRWHECSHGTAFKTDWMNIVVYEIASFMVFRQSVAWRWSHTRHHSDTIIRGRDPEIAVPRPPDILGICLQFFGLKSTPAEFKKILKSAAGIMDPDVATYLPQEENYKVFWRARIYLLIYAGVIGSAIYFETWLPFFYIGLPTIFGTWLAVVYGLTQHAGLQENVLDHRLNCRTVYMNRINRFLYWNMNYHVEHHMFPLVPYHALPKLHALMKDDCPTPYSSIYNAYQEIIPTLFKQVKDPTYYAQRVLPEQKQNQDNTGVYIGNKSDLKDGWITVCPTNHLNKGDVVRFDFDGETYAVYHTVTDQYYASEGICTHGSTHLAEGLVIGDQIECPKHNGRFDVKDGSVKRAPVCLSLKTYQVKVVDGNITLNIAKAGGKGAEEAAAAKAFKVVSNTNVATYIKELVLEPIEPNFNFQPGDYMQLEIPTYQHSFAKVSVAHEYKDEWNAQGLFDLQASNNQVTKRNYSMASNPKKDSLIKFNIRLATPPKEVACAPGVGSSYVFNLKAGDTVKAFGPYGDFRIKDKGTREKIYIGGGAGMAPLRAHISYLLETAKDKSKISFWYGARSKKELFYVDYFESLAAQYENFSFHIALSDPLPEDDWQGATGFIHEQVANQYLHQIDPTQVDYYLCGPPLMIKATQELLKGLNVSEDQISFDDFSS